MYEVTINSEQLEGVNLEVIKQYLRTEGCDAEDLLINEQVKVALTRAEKYCNRAFTAKEVTILSDLTEFPLMGTLDEIEEVKLDGVVTTENYSIKGKNDPVFYAETKGEWEVTHTTKANIPFMVQEYVRQSVYKMNERGEQDIPEPDHKLLNPLKRLIWLV
jgi:hypothetical protein